MSSASLLVARHFSIYEHRAKSATETKQSVVEVVHGVVVGFIPRENLFSPRFFYAYLSSDCREQMKRSEIELGSLSIYTFFINKYVI